MFSKDKDNLLHPSSHLPSMLCCRDERDLQYELGVIFALRNCHEVCADPLKFAELRGQYEFIVGPTIGLNVHRIKKKVVLVVLCVIMLVILHIYTRPLRISIQDH